jgi:hypothetical protein
MAVLTALDLTDNNLGAEAGMGQGARRGPSGQCGSLTKLEVNNLGYKGSSIIRKTVEGREGFVLEM